VWKCASQRRSRLVERARDALQNRLRLVVYDLSSDALERFYHRCLRFQPVYMNGYSSGIWRFADFILQSGSDGAALGLKLVVPTAEVLNDWQRGPIASAFGCPVMNEYGCREAHALAYECPAGRWHITHENVVVELLDDAGTAVPAGEPGYVTLTSLCNIAMPLIRYQNGDLAVMEPDVWCECGRHPGLPVLTRIVGRSSDVMYRSDGQHSHFSAIDYAMSRAVLPRGMFVEYQTRQKSVTNIELCLVKGPGYDDQTMERVIDHLGDVLGCDMLIDVKFVDTIDRDASGKLRPFISDIAGSQMKDGLPACSKPSDWGAS